MAWSGFTLLGVWVILANLREQLILDVERITQHGVISTKSMAIHNVTHIRWRQAPAGGSMVIHSPVNRLKVYLGNVTDSERKEIVTFFREAVDLELHEGWPEFESLQTRHATPISVRPSRSFVLVVGLIFLGFAGVFTYCWLLGIGARHLVLASINVAIAFWYLWRLWRLSD